MMIDSWIESLQAKYGEVLRIEIKMYWSLVHHRWVYEVEIAIAGRYYTARESTHEGAFRKAMDKL